MAPGRSTLTAAIARHGQPGFSPPGIKAAAAPSPGRVSSLPAVRPRLKRNAPSSTSSSSRSRQGDKSKLKLKEGKAESKRKSHQVKKRTKGTQDSSSLSGVSSGEERGNGAESESELSSARSTSSSGSSDEGSYEFWHKGEGTHLVERSVLAQQDGAVTCLSAKDLVMNNLKAYKHRQSPVPLATVIHRLILFVISIQTSWTRPA